MGAAVDMLRDNRALYTAWQTYAFPEKKKRNRASREVVGIAATSVPSKRRKMAVVVSDVNTDTDVDVAQPAQEALSQSCKEEVDIGGGGGGGDGDSDSEDEERGDKEN